MDSWNNIYIYTNSQLIFFLNCGTSQCDSQMDSLNYIYHSIVNLK
jgi:hypothetical protein